jgi:hypothetical protein
VRWKIPSSRAAVRGTRSSNPSLSSGESRANLNESRASASHKSAAQKDLGHSRHSPASNRDPTGIALLNSARVMAGPGFQPRDKISRTSGAGHAAAYRRRCRDGGASCRDERAFLRDLPNLACAAATYSYSPGRSRGLIPTLAPPHMRQGYRKGGRLQPWDLPPGPQAEGDRGFEFRSLQR